MKTIHPDTVHGTVNRVTNSIFAYQGWPTIARDEQGTLYAVSSSFRVSHICPFGKTVMYVSRNEGKTWSPPIVINDTYLDDRDGGILYMGNGRMLVSWFTHSTENYQYNKRLNTSIRKSSEREAYDAVVGMLNGYDFLPEHEKAGGSYVRISEDYGVTWSEKIKIPVSAPHGPSICRDGSLIYLGREMYGKEDLQEKATALYRSRDGGYSWKKECIIDNPEWLKPSESLEEPHIIELPDGRLLGAFRVEGRNPYTIAFAYSDDGGLCFGDMLCTNVSGAPPHLMLHSSGALICSYGRRQAPAGERAMVSYDFGKSWSEEYVLDERTAGAEARDIGYPSTVELDDGSLMTVYYQPVEGDKKPSILYTKWKLDR